MGSIPRLEIAFLALFISGCAVGKTATVGLVSVVGAAAKKIATDTAVSNPADGKTAAVKLVYSFCSNTAAQVPANSSATPVLGPDGSLYAVTPRSENRPHGWIFKVSPQGEVTELHLFNGADGSNPMRIVAGPDDALYGTTNLGGDNNDGTIFRITPSGVFASLHSFTGDDGKWPIGLTLGNDGSLYGVTGSGSDVSGTVFKITPSGTLTTLFKFPPITPADPNAGTSPDCVPTLDAAGNLYGTTTYGGAYNWGTLFKLAPAGRMTIVHSFKGTADEPGFPFERLTWGSDGNLYGIAYGDVTQKDIVGSVFRCSTAGDYATLHCFVRTGTELQMPWGGVTEMSPGLFYGVCEVGGPRNFGGVYKVTSTGGYSTVYDFVETDGHYPQSGLTKAADGALYGLSYSGGVFHVEPSGICRMLPSVGIRDGVYPEASVLVGPDGCFYGTCVAGGALLHGAVFKLTPQWQESIVHSFSEDDQIAPIAGLILGKDGNLYGVTSNTWGAAFKVTPSGQLTRLCLFNPKVGTNPTGNLVEAESGAFYGTAPAGGAHDSGTIFRIDKDGTVTDLYDFPAPASTEHEAKGSALYPPDYMERLPDSARKNLKRGEYFLDAPGWIMSGRTVRSGPEVGLTDGHDGFFYGVASWVGDKSEGEVFKISPDGKLTVLHSFEFAQRTPALIVGPDQTPGVPLPTPTMLGITDPDGAYPLSPLVKGLDGYFYGTTHDGGQYGNGTIYRFGPDGTYETLYSFSHFGAPVGSLAQDTDGTWYGVATGVGPEDQGGIYEMTAGGDVSLIYVFDGGAGAAPMAGLLRIGPGDFVGTATSGGTSKKGSVYELTVK